jgi:hypothetical protein
MVELREMTDSRTVLLVYSTLARLSAAFGAGQSAMRLPAEDLSRLRRRLRFHAVLLEVRPPVDTMTEPARDVTEPLPLTVDNVTGEPIGPTFPVG